MIFLLLHTSQFLAEGKEEMKKLFFCFLKISLLGLLAYAAGRWLGGLHIISGLFGLLGLRYIWLKLSRKKTTQPEEIPNGAYPSHFPGAHP